MGHPSENLATLRPDLAAGFMEWDYEMNAAGLIGARVCPIMDVAEAFGQFGRLPLASMLQKRETRRRESGDYNRSNWKFDKDNFDTEEHGLEEPIDNKEKKMYRNWFDLDEVSAGRVFNGLLLGYEQRVADRFLDTSIFDTGSGKSAPCSTTWKDFDNSEPIQDVKAACEASRDVSGVWPNTVIMTRRAFRDARESKSLIDRIKFWGGDDPKTKGVTKKVLADVFDVENVEVANTVQNVAHEGQDPSLEEIWNDDIVVVCSVRKSRDIRAMTLARTFHWAEDGGDINGIIEEYMDMVKRRRIMRARHQTGEKIMYEKLGYHITGVSAAPS